MKRIFKKNQIIIAALAVMIAAAGYLNYSGRLFSGEDDAQEANADLASQELLDISEEDLASASGDIESQDSEAEDGSVEGTPGEAVLTSGEVSGVVAEAKVTREQVRAKNKESLAELSDANRAQIEDIVTRKTGVAAENVVITPVNAQGEEAK